MISLDFNFEAELWASKGQGAWYFLTLPQEMSADIKAFTKSNARGFRSVRVSVRIGGSEWLTSLFPDKASGCYFLPIKASIRRAEKIEHGDVVAVFLEIFI